MYYMGIPPQEFFKTNFDTAVDLSGKKGAIADAIVVRDGTGKLVDRLCQIIQHISNPTILESHPCREADKLALIRGWKNTIVEGDCFALIISLNNAPCQSSAVM